MKEIIEKHKEIVREIKLWAASIMCDDIELAKKIGFEISRLESELSALEQNNCTCEYPDMNAFIGKKCSKCGKYYGKPIEQTTESKTAEITVLDALNFIKDKNIPSLVDRGYIARWMIDFYKSQQDKVVSDKDIEKASLELSIESKGVNLPGEMRDMNLEMLQTGFKIGAKAMKNGLIKPNTK